MAQRVGERRNMAKKDRQSTADDQQPLIDNSQDAKTKAESYKIELWSGEMHYQCNLCPFDTFDRTAMDEHQDRIHHMESTAEQTQPAAEIFEVDLKEDQDAKNNPY